MDIRVKNSGVITLQATGRSPTGMLYVAEAEHNIPFGIRRAYFMSGMEQGAVRGNHAHRILTQAIFVAHGSFALLLDDGVNKQEILMTDPGQGIILGPHLWVSMKDFSPDCVIIILADDYYDERDYIRDYEEFNKIVK